MNEIKIDETTFLKENLNSKFSNDYFGYLNFCKPPKMGYSGVAIYSKVKPISVKHDLGITKHDHVYLIWMYITYFRKDAQLH